MIDKDRNPRWSPPRMEDVTPEMVAPYFAEIGADELVFEQIIIETSGRRELKMANIAFIGLGNMGGPMAANLVKAGHKVVAFDLVAASRDQAKADGAAIADSSVAAVKGAEVVITMLPAGKHVLSVWTEILPSMTKGSLIIDCSTIDVESANAGPCAGGKARHRSRSMRRCPAAPAAPRARR